MIFLRQLYRMNILLINHYAGSPNMGMEYRPYYLAKEWLNSGNKVTIILATHSHLRQYNPKIETNIKEEIIDGINYVWINTPKYDGNGVGRIKNMFAFIKTTYLNSKYFANKYKPDVVIASSTYPSDNYVAKKIAKISKAKYIYEVHDLWPLSPMELGGMSKYHPFIMAMQHAENFAYKNADAVVSMLPNTHEHMKLHGLDLKKWHYIPNGIVIADWEKPKELNEKTKSEIIEIKQKYNKIVAYTGTIGLANALNNLVLASVELKTIAFVIVGKGPEKPHLVNMVKENNIKNVFFVDVVNKHEMPSLLKLFDYLYIGLQYQPLFRFGISPNKLIDYMMSEKPIIQAIKAGNNMVKEANCGLDIEPENSSEIVKAILKLESSNVIELEQMAKNGRAFVLKNHDYKILSNNFIQIMQNI